MSDFFNIHLPEIISIAFLLIFFLISYGILHRIMKLLIKRSLKKRPEEDAHLLRVVKRILKIMLFISFGSALIMVFLNDEQKEIIDENSTILWYVGLVTVISIITASKAETFFIRKIKEKSEIEKGDATSYRFLRYLVVFGIYFLGAIFVILAFPSLRGLAKTALGGAGVLALVAGLASQETFANIIGGIFIVAFKPFKINDVIKISDELMGTVTDITLRHTVIKNFENKMIIIPNNIINKEKVINFDLGDQRVCQWIEVGISYDSDVDLALKLLQDTCEAHPLVLDVRSDEDKTNGIPKVVVRVVKLDDSSVNLKAWAWAENFGNGFQVKCDLNYQIKKLYDQHGIEIPFPHRTMVFKEDQIDDLAKKIKTS